MTPEQEKQWSEEFEKLANEREISPINAIYRDIYLAARQKAQDDWDSFSRLMCTMNATEFSMVILTMKIQKRDKLLKQALHFIHSVSADYSGKYGDNFKKDADQWLKKVEELK